ncbi:MAG: glycosyltransferase family 39 protein [Clostridiaceae bacterium]
MQNKRRITTLLIAVIFACMFFVGVLHYQDYGVSVDEMIQRQHSLIAYKYVMKQVFHRDVQELEDYPSVPEYENRYYGTFLQMPMVFLEDLHDFQTDLGDVMRTRHLITFVYCFISYICFYFLGKRVFQNRWLALLGSVMLYLYPRFFATQFFYIKDMLFAATFMVAMWATVLFIEKEEKPLYGILFCIVSAICANVRFIGMLFPALVIAYLLIRDLFIRRVYRNGVKAVLRSLIVPALLAIGFLVVYVAIHPTCWVTPLRSMVAVIKKFSYYDTWQGTSLFMGQWVPRNDDPWSFIPVWLMNSHQVWYQLLFLCALVLSVLLIVFPKRFSKRMFPLQAVEAKQGWLEALLQAPYRYVLFALALFLGPLLLVILRKSVLYGDWRQMYFLLVPYVFLAQSAVFAFIRCCSRNWLKTTAALAICGALLFQTGWIVKNHPYEHQYLNSFAVPYRTQFLRDTTRTSLYNAIKYLLKHAEEDVIVINSNIENLIVVQFQVLLLTPEEQSRIRFEPDGMYELADYRLVVGNNVSHDGYELWYTIYVEGCPIASVLRNASRAAD